MIESLLAVLDRQRLWLPVLIRIVVGATFTLHGYEKVFVQGIGATARTIAQSGVPLGGVLGPLVPIIEFFGGVCVLIGLGTRLWAFMQAWVMIFAIAFAHGKQGFAMHGEIMNYGGKDVPVPAGWEWQALLLACCLTLVVAGAGVLSIDHLIRKKCQRPAPPAP